MTIPVPRLRRGVAPTFVVACGLSAAVAAAVPDVSGRWQGSVDIPGHPMPLVVDLERDAGGQWQGSAILPGRGVKGTPLSELSVQGCDVAFRLAATFDGAPPRIALGCLPDGALAGSFTLAGNSARVSLRRSGPAQVDRVPPNSVITPALAGRWTGRYELGGVPRAVTLTLANRPGQGGGGQLVIVGKRTSTLVVDQVTQGREFVVLNASAADFRIEGRLADVEGRMEGVVLQGPFEAAIVLLRDPAAAGEPS